MSYTVIETPGDGDPVIAGSTTTIYLVSRLPRLSDGTEQTDDVYEGPETPIREMYEDYKTYTSVADISMSKGQAGKYVLNVTWGVGPLDITPGVTEQAEWDLQPVEVVVPLAAHPYFQVAYVAASAEIIEDRIAEVDHAIATGTPYTSSGDYKDWVKRYYGLRLAGVNGYHAHGVSLTKVFRTDDLADIHTYVENVGKVVDINIDIAPPVDIETLLEKFRRVTSYGSADPSSYVYTANEWEFVQKSPVVQGPEEGPWEVQLEWIGLDQWSAVLYPDGSWDPQGATS